MPAEMTDPAPDVQELPENYESAFTDAAAEAATGATKSPEPATPPADASPSPPAGSVESPPAGPAISSAFLAAQEAGVDTSGYEDDAALIAGLHKQSQELRQYADYGRQVLPYDRQFREFQQQQAQDPSPAPEQKTEKPWDVGEHFTNSWKQPEYEQGWDAFLQSGMIQQDPNGQFVPAEGQHLNVPPNVLQGMNAHRVWQRQALETLVNNPFQTTWDAFQEPLSRLIEERVQKTLGEYDSSQSMTGWEAENSKLLYEHDGNDKVINDIYGNPKATAYGEAFIQAAQELRQSGVNDTDQILRLASQMTRSLLPTATPKEGNGAPVPTPTPESEKPASFMQEAIAKAGHNPSPGAYAEGEGQDPVARDNTELENMFTVAAKKAGVT